MIYTHKTKKKIVVGQFTRLGNVLIKMTDNVPIKISDIPITNRTKFNKYISMLYTWIC